MHSEREKFLLFRIRTHQDQRAFAELFLEYKKSLYTFLCSRLSSTEDADDMLNTVFLRAWNFILTSHSTDKDHFSGLVFHIARYAIKDYWKGKKNDASLSEMQESGRDFEDTQRSSGAIEAGAELRMIRDALHKLPEEFQEVIVLRVFEQLDFNEIAKRMEKTAGAVRVTLHRALKELRTLL